MTSTIIITAGGIGKRMNTAVPKQFLLLNGTPILMHTIQRFFDFDAQAQLLVTLPAIWFNEWALLCEQHNFTLKHHVVEGGTERFDSIKEALKLATGEVICIHDGVRPFVSTETIQAVFDAVHHTGASIPVIEVNESLRHVLPNSNIAVDRSKFKQVQTPQCFEASLLKKAYEKEYQPTFTDDASVVENIGVKITLVPGNAENIKITSPLDLAIGELLFKQ
jgi:2-C-methyl-D-erythritol 4-phosphate cytidylyltransferase